MDMLHYIYDPEALYKITTKIFSDKTIIIRGYIGDLHELTNILLFITPSFNGKILRSLLLRRSDIW